MFKTNPESLSGLLAEAQDGRLQLPDFQREYVWADEDVRSLLASVVRGFPVGALLTLEAGGQVSFKPRMVESADMVSAAPERLLLDGQQRITSLHGALRLDGAMTVLKQRGYTKREARRYFIDIASACQAGADLNDAIVSVPQKGILLPGDRDRTDLWNTSEQHRTGFYPFNLAYDAIGQMNWLMSWVQTQIQAGKDPIPLQASFVNGPLAAIAQYKMPVIELAKQSSREAICLIFEKVNVGGKKLDAFELVTAIFAGSPSHINLREDWEGIPAAKDKGRRGRIISGALGTGQENKALAEVRNTDFLQAVSLVQTRKARHIATLTPGSPLPQVSCKREALLALKLVDYKLHADGVENGFREAGRLLYEQRIFWSRDVPYPAQVVCLAAVIATLGHAAKTMSAKDKLARWFWRTALSEDFGASTESKMATDLLGLIEWIEKGTEPERLAQLEFSAARLDTMRSRLSAAYKAVSPLLLAVGARDFITGTPAEIGAFTAEPMDIHHVFPRAWFIKAGRGNDPRMDSIVNKTPLTARSNRVIGGRAPSEYLIRLEREGTSLRDRQEIDDLVRTHLIDPEHLRADDFDAFYRSRKEALSQLIGQAMGRSPSPGRTDDADFGVEEDVQYGDSEAA